MRALQLVPPEQFLKALSGSEPRAAAVRRLAVVLYLEGRMGLAEAVAAAGGDVACFVAALRAVAAGGEQHGLWTALCAISEADLVCREAELARLSEREVGEEVRAVREERARRTKIGVGAEQPVTGRARCVEGRCRQVRPPA
jgi:hypothetical protein